ncbi:MAG: diadenylate cyclase CdaA [Phycisphaeraceae bacterium]
MGLERLEQLFQRLQGYLWTQPVEVFVEIAVIWVVVYAILRFLRGTRGARVIKGVAVILIVGTLAIQVLGRENAFERLNFLYSNFLAFASLMLVIVFQPELRRALVRLGETRLFRQAGLRKARVVEEVLASAQYLSRTKIGALIAIERQVGLGGIVELGTRIDAEVSKELLNTIFWPGSALHDMGVIIRGDRVMAAGVQFPLAESDTIPQELGSRHRAAIGLSQESDAMVLVVSEETGTISVAERGDLTRGLSVDELRPILTRGLGSVTITDRSETTDNSSEQADLSDEGGLGSRT